MYNLETVPFAKYISHLKTGKYDVVLPLQKIY